MAHAESQNSLLVLGVHLKSEGYPNTLYRLQDLETSGLFCINEINVPMWTESTQNHHGFSRLTRSGWRATCAHIAVIARYLVTARRSNRVYVPYPGVFVLFLLSCLPSRLRPRRVVADVFISLYDTIVLDRRLLKRGGVFARILKWVETRAYVYADKLVVDTEQNARFICTLFSLPESKAIVTPLSIDETHFKFTPYQPQPGICRVLFVGTLVPLHGIGTLLEAARLLSGRSDIQFKLIGDGQDAHLVEACLKSQAMQLEWVRDWQASSRIAEEISQADICLGIFGAGNKTQRVCPFKTYAYASVGRAIITGETKWLKETTARSSCEPFASVPVNNAAALAAKIVQLADDPRLRGKLAASSHAFYQTHLGNRPALEKLSSCLLDH
jgi:glycosyltransferase involved in cell wall biosynthesis